ncbi:gamma-aminobutyric acid receptor alpha-like isoform X3 [Monomorium pharaonis]|uniref:gamma-aminobutyric acid receptor alpha-like isoform X3 n=1 Tax=Monomorium pharaonis TaxID=307658 RepID=UPI001747A41F|nr:gamma-aminobutyric acid receptor alpha-like isoform X3 [Monomorium pharaonis]
MSPGKLSLILHVEFIASGVMDTLLCYVRSLVILVPLTVYKYHYYAFETKATSSIATPSKSLNSMLTFDSRMPRATLNDTVSKNITLVLENLLMNYENSQLPTHGKGVPTVVKINILIKSMGPVSELDMDYSMDCYFRQSWRDSRLSFLGPIKSLSLSIKMLERIWRPDTYFYNGKNSYVHTITVPNKLLRITQDGDILYSMRLTIKAKCPMELRNFPMDRQFCPLIMGSCITTVLTLSTISLDSRTDLPKVRYATALDWFLLMSFGYCIATLLEFAGVHYFTKVDSGEIPLDDEELEEWKGIASEEFEDTFRMISCSPQAIHPEIIDTSTRKRGSLMSALYSDDVTYERDSCHSITVAVSSKPSTMERQTQTEFILPIWRQFLYCLAGDDAFRRRRQREAANNYRKCGYRMSRRHINSVSYIDRVARIVFPASFGLLNVCYWVVYVTYQEEFKWQDPPIGSITPISH